MFVDASVIAAMMTDETEARAFAIRMQASTVRLTSPMAVADAASSVADSVGLPLGQVAEAVRTFLQLMNIQLVAIPPRAAFLALEAQATFGAGVHPAALNHDQCMTYACARYYRQPLLFRNGGFADTDIGTA